MSWQQRHRIYKKSRRRLTRLVAHDQLNLASIGDRVLLEESRPLSRTKRWRLIEIVQKVDVAEFQPAEIDRMPGETLGQSSEAEAV